MQNKNQIQIELQDLGIHLPKIQQAPFDTPVNYFNDLSSNMLQIAKNQSFIENLSKENPFQAPSTYFENFSSELQNKIQEIELTAALSKANPYEMPAGYFENFEVELAKKIDDEKNTPALRPIRNVNYIKRTLSIAASILLILQLSFTLLQSKHQASIEQKLATISNDEIQSFLNKHEFEFELANNSEPLTLPNEVIDQLEDELFQKQLNEVPIEEFDNFIL
ncbi:MAG: hypothetical protein R2831_08660 [Chitinophagaceae bacterium]